MTDANAAGEILTAQHVMEYPYRRSLGPVLSAFFTGLRDRTILGARTRDGRVLVPPSGTTKRIAVITPHRELVVQQKPMRYSG